MSIYAWRRSFLASISALAVGLSATQLAPQAVAEPHPSIEGNLSNGTYGFDASPDFDADPLWEQTQLATAGEEGYDCYRIPALNTAKDGTLLASYDGRPRGCGDAPTPNSIVQKRSVDGGKTWSAQIDIAPAVTSRPPTGYSDPSYIVDRETGTIFNFHVKSFDQGLRGSRTGTNHDDRNILQAAYAKSDDGGITWSYDHVITRDITTNPAWRARFATSGNGIQLQYGEHKGRLVQPAMVIVDKGPHKANAWLSDDHGETWYPSLDWGTGMDENKIVELSNGVLMNNSRSSFRNETARKISYSYDGGYSWTEPRLDPQLPDPRNNASIIRAFPNAPQGSALAKVLLFSNSATTGPDRTNGTIRMSCDDGQTWPVAKEFNAGDTQYTIMTTLADGNIGILWEDNIRPATNIYFARFNLAWLGASCLNVEGKTPRVVAGDTATFPVTITNSTAREIFNRPVEFTAPEGWTLSTEPAVVSLGAGESKTLDVTVTAPKKGNNGLNHIQLFIPNGRVNSVGEIDVDLTGAIEQTPAGAGEYWDTTAKEPTAFVAIKNPQPKDEWHVGDTIDYEFAVFNPNFFFDKLRVIPSGSSLENFQPPATKNCRWGELNQMLAKCPFPSYTLTEDDLARGYFETETTWTFTNLSNNKVTTQKLLTPRVSVVEKPVEEVESLADFVRIDIEALGEASKNDAAGADKNTMQVPVKIHATSNTGVVPEDTTVELFLDGKSVGTQPVTGDEAEFTISIPLVEIGKDPVIHKMVARPHVTAKNFRGIDGFGSIKVLPADKSQGRTTLTLAELADVQTGSVPGNKLLLSAKLQRNGKPVSGQEVKFNASTGQSTTGITNAEGVALAQLEISTLNQPITEDVEISISAETPKYESTTEVFDSARAEQKFTVTPAVTALVKPDTNKPDTAKPAAAKIDWVAIVAIVAAVLAALSPLFQLLLDRIL